MKKVYKICIAVVSFVGLVYSVFVFSMFRTVPLLSEAFYDIMNVSGAWLSYAFAVMSVLVGLCFFALILMAFFTPSREEFLVIDKGNGKLLISKKTIQTTALYSFSDIMTINYADVRAQLNKNPDNSKIIVKISLTDSSELVTIAETVRDRIESSLLRSLGVSVKSVTIQVIERLDKESRKDIETAPDGMAKGDDIKHTVPKGTDFKEAAVEPDKSYYGSDEISADLSFDSDIGFLADTSFATDSEFAAEIGLAAGMSFDSEMAGIEFKSDDGEEDIIPDLKGFSDDKG